MHAQVYANRDKMTLFLSHGNGKQKSVSLFIVMLLCLLKLFHSFLPIDILGR